MLRWGDFEALLGPKWWVGTCTPGSAMHLLGVGGLSEELGCPEWPMGEVIAFE